MLPETPGVRAAKVGVVAVAFGLLVAWFDVAAPFGDDTTKGTIFLWLVCCGGLGLLHPRRPWRWAALVGPCVPLAHLALHALGRPHSLDPNTYATALLLVPVSLGVCLVGVYAGAFARAAACRA